MEVKIDPVSKKYLLSDSGSEVIFQQQSEHSITKKLTLSIRFGVVPAICVHLQEGRVSHFNELNFFQENFVLN